MNELVAYYAKCELKGQTHYWCAGRFVSGENICAVNGNCWKWFNPKSFYHVSLTESAEKLLRQIKRETLETKEMYEEEANKYQARMNKYKDNPECSEYQYAEKDFLHYKQKVKDTEALLDMIEKHQVEICKIVL